MTTDPLAYLHATLDAAEAEAEAATKGPWEARPPTDDGDGWEIRAVVTPGREWRWVIGAESGGGVYDEPDARHIARHDPAAVLRRIQADRKLIAEHQSTVGWDGGSSNGRVCATCAQDTQDGDRSGDPYPCATLRYLAEGWEWTGEET